MTANRPPFAPAVLLAFAAFCSHCGNSNDDTKSSGGSGGSTMVGSGGAGASSGNGGTSAGGSGAGAGAGAGGSTSTEGGVTGGAGGTAGAGATGGSGGKAGGGATGGSGGKAGGGATGGAGGAAGSGATGGSGGTTADAAADGTVGDAPRPVDATTPSDAPTGTDARPIPDGTTGTTDGGNGADGADGPTGFAAIPGMGLNTTTGGRGGMRVTVTTFADLSAYLDSDDTLIILVQGAIDLGGSMVPMRSNKTLVGLAGARLVNGGIEMNRRQNVVIRNLTFADGTDDTLKINQNTHHIWVDHCDFSNAPDGLFDITRQSSYITISWNHFHNHSKTMLIGHSDGSADDTGYLKTTIHHNWFNGTEQRHPRVRFGEVHVFNNYFLSNALYGVASTMEADVVVEGNYFEGVLHPTYVGYDASGPGDLVERNNVYDNSGTPETRGTAFDPSAAYPYVVDDPASLRAVVRTKTGVGVIDPLKAAQ